MLINVYFQYQQIDVTENWVQMYDKRFFFIFSPR